MRTCTNRIPDNGDTYECGRPVVRGNACERCLPGEIEVARRKVAEAERAAADARARLAALEEPTDHAKQWARIETLLALIPAGVWSWERDHRVADERRDSWTLYVDRGEPIVDDLPRGHPCNQQHGWNILGGAEFDRHGAALRAFIVEARRAVPDLLAEQRMLVQTERILDDVAQAAGVFEALPDELPAQIRAVSEALAAAGIPDDGRSLAERVKDAAEQTRAANAVSNAVARVLNSLRSILLNGGRCPN